MLRANLLLPNGRFICPYGPCSKDFRASRHAVAHARDCHRTAIEVRSLMRCDRKMSVGGLRHLYLVAMLSNRRPSVTLIVLTVLTTPTFTTRQAKGVTSLESSCLC